MMNQADKMEYRGVREVARRLGVSINTAHALLRSRRIAHRFMCGAYRVSEEAIQDFERRCTFEVVAA